MPRRRAWSEAQSRLIYRFPDDEQELLRWYTLDVEDIEAVNQHRGNRNRLGFAFQLCCLRWPGTALQSMGPAPDHVVEFIANQIDAAPAALSSYATRDTTRREHLAELYDITGIRPFTNASHEWLVSALIPIAERTDDGLRIAEAAIGRCREAKTCSPPVTVLERIVAKAVTSGERNFFEALAKSATPAQHTKMLGLVAVEPEARRSRLSWLQEPPGKPRPKYIVEHLERLSVVEAVALKDRRDIDVDQGRLAKLGHQGQQMTVQHLSDLEPLRRQATLTALIVETRSTLIDEVIDLHDRYMQSLFSRAKRVHDETFSSERRQVNDLLDSFSKIAKALVDANDNGTDPSAAVSASIGWEQLRANVASIESLKKRTKGNHLSLLSSHYGQVRRYAPSLLANLTIVAASPAASLAKAVELLRHLNNTSQSRVPADAPIDFVPRRWLDLVVTKQGINRNFYELCVLSQLRNGLRSGDVSVPGSRKHRDFEHYLVTSTRFNELKATRSLPIAEALTTPGYLDTKLDFLHSRLQHVDQLLAKGELSNVTISPTGRLRIPRLASDVPSQAVALQSVVYQMLPNIKITELLGEVNSWTGFSSGFTHLRKGTEAPDTHLLLATVLADAVNLGLTKMAVATPAATYEKLAWLHSWHISHQNYQRAIASIVNAHHEHPLSSVWGDGTSSSSDGQHFKLGGVGKKRGDVNLRYGTAPGVLFYTHISDQYAPFYSKVIGAGVRDSTHVLDGLLYHGTDLQIEEHHTDTAGFTDHVFALMGLLGFRFVPRIRDLHDKRLYAPGKRALYRTLQPLIAKPIDVALIKRYHAEVLRLATSISQGTVRASLILSKLGAYPRQNGLARALREYGRIDRTLFVLGWYENADIRSRSQGALNKGESRNQLARAVMFHQLGEIRDKRFDDQQHRASGLNLVTAAIIYWNTVYIGEAVRVLQAADPDFDASLVRHVSPLGWDHINLTGEYRWESARGASQGLRPLRGA